VKRKKFNFYKTPGFPENNINQSSSRNRPNYGGTSDNMAVRIDTSSSIADFNNVVHAVSPNESTRGTVRNQQQFLNQRI
jgi:hypothetical protein